MRIYPVPSRPLRSIRSRCWEWGLPLGLLLWWCLPAVDLPAQNPANWRVYRAGDGLQESSAMTVTISPRTNVWVKHAQIDGFSMLDGYTTRNLPAPEEGGQRIYQGLTHQIWTVYTEGLQEYRDDQWIKHPIPAIRQEIRNNVLQQLRLSVIPAERNRVLFLLSDRLMAYQAVKGTTREIQHVNQTRLGQFRDMIPAREGGLWVTGDRGVARISAPLHSIHAGSEWTEYVAEESLEVRNFQRPMENPNGGLTLLADSDRSSRRVVVSFQAGRWVIEYSPQENLRNAWRDWQGRLWAHEINSLFRLADGQKEIMADDYFLAGQFFDVALEPDGIFWLATSEGLVRYAPLIWQTSPGASELHKLVTDILQDRRGDLWFATTTALLHWDHEQWTTYSLPPATDTYLQARDAMYSLPDGRIALSSVDQFFLFDPAGKHFEPVEHPHGLRVRLIGRRSAGGLYVKTHQPESSGKQFQLEVYRDGTFQPFSGPQPGGTLGSELYFIHEAENGDLWLGGNAGLGRLREGNWHYFSTEDGYLDDGAFCVLEHSNGNLWFGGRNAISRFDGQNWSLVKTRLDRVSSMIQVRDGSVWVGTGNGVFRYHEKSWVRNSVEEGLPNATIYEVFQDSQQQLWAGTGRGISRYQPEVDPEPPETYLLGTDEKTEFLSNRPFTLRFDGLDKWKATPKDRLMYSYRLDEEEWMPFTSETELTLANLSGGNHRFQVRAMDRNWNIDAEPATFEFIVVLPWYQDSRLILISVVGLMVILVLAGLAVNRHLQLVRSYAEVGRIVEQRTRELERANQELLQSQKMTALGTLAAGIAHDFNNILSIIKGSAQIIENHPADRQKVHTRINRIKTVVDQGAGIVKALLGFSRLSNQKQTSCDVQGGIEETIKVLEDRLPKETTIQYDLADALPPARGTKELLQPMLTNLILNASDAMSGKGTIILRSGTMDALPEDLILTPAAAEQYVYIGVQDTGCGIAPETLSRIFEPFFTTKSFSSRRGTGLGLSMVYEFAKELGFGLRVESAQGQGSTFTLILPAGPSDPKEGDSTTNNADE